jgi:hypothetical protein
MALTDTVIWFATTVWQAAELASMATTKIQPKRDLIRRTLRKPKSY